MALEARSLQAFSSAPGEEGLGGRALLWLVLAQVGSAISCTIRLLHPGTLMGLVWSFQLGIARVMPAITSVLYPQRRRLLCWIRSQVPAREVPDLAAMWRNGALLCALVEASVAPDPQLGCRFDKYRGSAVPSMKLGQKLAAEYLRVPPEFSDAELESTLTPAIMSRLVSYLSALERAAARLRDGSQDSPLDEPEFTARGMGLVMAVQGRRATFSLYPTQRRHLFTSETDSILVQIQGPNNDMGSVLISSHSTQVHHTSGGLRKIIPITVVMTLETIRVTYTPRSPGHHQLSLLFRGHHIANSPHDVSVEPRDVRNDFINMPILMKPSSKVLSRIVDFVTEKRILTDDGRLIEIEKQSGMLTRQLSVKKRTGHIFGKRKLIGKRQLLGFKSSDDKSKDSSTSSKSDVQIIVHEAPDNSRKSPTGRTEFKDSCKRILWICDLLLKNSNKDRSLRMLNTAEQILSEGKDNASVNRDHNPSPISEQALCRLRGHLHANAGGLNEVSTLHQESTSSKKVVLREYSNTLRPDNIPPENTEELNTESLPIISNKNCIISVRRCSEPIEISRGFCGLDEMDEMLGNDFCTVNKSTNDLKTDEIITKEDVILKANDDNTKENLIKINEEILINNQESSDVNQIEKVSGETKSPSEEEHKTLDKSLSKVDENLPPGTENSIKRDNKISLNPDVSNQIDETNIDISKNTPSTSESIVDLAIKNHDSILASTNLEEALKYFEESSGFKGNSEIMQNKIKVEDWMGPAEKEIWDNELEWYESEMYKSKDQDDDDDNVFIENKSDMQILSDHSETGWEDDIEKVLSDTYLHKNKVVLERQTSLRRKRFKDMKAEPETKEEDSNNYTSTITLAPVVIAPPDTFNNDQRLLHAIVEEATPSCTPVNEEISTIPYITPIFTPDQYELEAPLIASTNPSSNKQYTAKSDMDNTKNKSSETSNKSSSIDIENSNQFQEKYKLLSYSKNINKTEEDIEVGVDALENIYNEVSPRKDIIAIETELKETSKKTSKDTSLCDIENNKLLEIDIISELRRDSESLAIIRNFTESVDESDVIASEIIENKSPENIDENNTSNCVDLIDVEPEKILLEENIHKTEVEIVKNIIDSNAAEIIDFIDIKNTAENATVENIIEPAVENYTNNATNYNTLATPLIDLSSTESALIDCSPKIILLPEKGSKIVENSLNTIDSNIIENSLNAIDSSTVEAVNIIDSINVEAVNAVDSNTVEVVTVIDSNTIGTALVDFIDINKSIETNINAVENTSISPNNNFHTNILQSDEATMKLLVDITSADKTPLQNVNNDEYFKNEIKSTETIDSASTGSDSKLANQSSVESTSSKDDSIIGVTRRLSQTLRRFSLPHDSLHFPEYLSLLAHSPDIDYIGTPEHSPSKNSQSIATEVEEIISRESIVEDNLLLNLNTTCLLDIENNILPIENYISDNTDINLNKNITLETEYNENSITDATKNYTEKINEIYDDKMDSKITEELLADKINDNNTVKTKPVLVKQESSADSLTSIINQLQHERNLHHAKLEELKQKRKNLGETLQMQDKFDFSILRNENPVLESTTREVNKNENNMQDVLDLPKENEISTLISVTQKIEREDSKSPEEISDYNLERRESLVSKRKSYWDEKISSLEDPKNTPPLPSNPPPPKVETKPRYLQKTPSVQLSGIVARSLQCFEQPQTEQVHDAIFYARRAWATPTITPEPEVPTQTPDLIASQNKVKYTPKKYEYAPEIIPNSFNNKPKLGLKKVNPDSELEQYSLNIGSKLSVFQANSSKSPILPKSPIKTNFNQPDIISSKIHSKPTMDIDFDSKPRVSVSNIASKFNTKINTSSFPIIKAKPLNKKSLRDSYEEPVAAIRKNSASPPKTKDSQVIVPKTERQTKECDPISNIRAGSLSIKRDISSSKKYPISTDRNLTKREYKIDLVQSRMNPTIHQTEVIRSSNSSFNTQEHSITDNRKPSSTALTKSSSYEHKSSKDISDSSKRSSLDSKLTKNKFSLHEIKTESQGLEGPVPNLPVKRGSVRLTKELLDRKENLARTEVISPEEALYHTVKYTTGEATVAIVPSRSRGNSEDDHEQDIKPKGRKKSLMHQFSIEVTPSLAIETNFVNPLCDLNADISPTPPVSKPERIKCDGETKDRFEKAKNFFKTLEVPKGAELTGGSTGRNKGRRTSLAVPPPTLKHSDVNKFSSERQTRMNERFHVKDLFRHIEDKAVGARGIPNPLAVVAALNSAVDEGGATRAVSPYEMTRPDEGTEGTEELEEPEANGLQRRGSLEKRLTFKRLSEKTNAEMF